MMRATGRNLIARLHVGLLSVGLLVGLVACSATFDNHGYVPPQEDLQQLRIGASRDDVADIIGRPGASGVIREEAWFYTAYRVRNYGYQAPEIIERQVLAVSFDGRGRVSNIEEFSLNDGRAVQLSRRVTSSTVQEVSFFRQLLSNFGRINVGQVLDQ
jgi:outer membrane protein assembly factor BamE (lipoprotein component of BamABCDE complex)